MALELVKSEIDAICGEIAKRLDNVVAAIELRGGFRDIVEKIEDARDAYTELLKGIAAELEGPSSDERNDDTRTTPSADASASPASRAETAPEIEIARDGVAACAAVANGTGHVVSSPEEEETGSDEARSASPASTATPASTVTAPLPSADGPAQQPSAEVDGGASPSDAPTVRCSWGELCSHKEGLLAGACRDRRAGLTGYARLKVDDLPALEGQMRQPGKKHFTHFRYETHGGFTKVRHDPPKVTRRIPAPTFPLTGPAKTQWSRQELEGALEQILEHPPEGAVAYIIGEPLFQYEEMSPGDKLRRRGGGNIPGCNTQFVYLNVSGGPALTVHHKEDAETCSINVNLSGENKGLITVRPEHAQRFEDLMRAAFEAEGDWPCSSSVRHWSRVVHPSQLREWGIRYDVDIFGPGEGFFTLPGTYHAVVNLGNNCAIAINYELDTSPPMPEDYRFCTDRCPGMSHITEEDWKMGARELPVGASAKAAKKRTALPGARPEIFPNTSLPRATPADLRPKSSSTRTPLKRRPEEALPVRESPKKRHVEKPRAEPASKQAAKKPSLSYAKELREIEEVKEKMGKLDRMCTFPDYDKNVPPDPRLYRLAAVVHSRIVIRQFCQAVSASRQPDTDRSRPATDMDRATRVEKKLTKAAAFEDQKLLARLHMVSIARDLYDNKDNFGRTRADVHLTKQVREELGWSASKFKEAMRDAREWMRISPPELEGILCFYLSELEKGLDVRQTEYREMKQADIPGFLKLLDNGYIRALCSVGKAFHDSRNGDDVEFRWESDNEMPDAKPEEEMLRLLKPFPTTSENVYKPSRYPDWSRPPGWPDSWPWPADPTWIPDSERQCDLCEESSCDCIDKAFPKPQPRIKRYSRYESSTLGLQAMARQAGEMAYKKGTLIGHLAGELVPLGTYDDSWTVQFVRPCLGEEAAVCQIYSGEVGNIFRLVNHSCKPVANLEGKRVSGRWVEAVVAARDIFDGTEITVSYGAEAKPRPCLCLGCRKDAPQD